MNYKWILPVGALVLLGILIMINDNSDDDYSENHVALLDEQNAEITEESVFKTIDDIDIIKDVSKEATDTSKIPVGLSDGIEIPVNGLSHGVYLYHLGYSLSFDTINHCPFWVAWELTSNEVQGKYGRSNDFREDPQLPIRHQVSKSDFSGSGYDRGHMCPAGDQKWSELAMSESFYMSNMCPQAPKLNQVWWEHLEDAERRWAQQEGSVYIVCGPIFNNNKTKWIYGSNAKIGIPDSFFKVFLSLREGKEKAIGFIFKNDDSRQPVGGASCSVNKVEEITGYDFFSHLEDELEERLESNFNLGKWD